MRQPGCAECEQLWQDYTAATFEHVNIDSRMKMAELRQDVSVTLTKAHAAAAEKREAAQRRLKAHEAAHAERVSSAEG
jgi:ribosomal protein L12E/L44/L45/RPP1/RPP2